MKNKRVLTIVALLIFAIAASYAFPRPKQKKHGIITQLDIPYHMIGWVGKNISIGINEKERVYFFIGDTFSREYHNKYGEIVRFIILDAGNFHNPKVCLGGSGFQSKDLPEAEIRANNRTIKATTVLFEKPGESYLIIYWLSIDKKIVSWNRQKLLQFWYSLFNKDKIGLMVRFEIPTTPGREQESVKLAKEFIADIAQKVDPSQAEYIFGK